MCSPPVSEASDPTGSGTSKRSVKEAQHARLSDGERQALYMLALAYVSMSRISEVSGLGVMGVDEKGGLVRVRPRTAEKLWRLLTKRSGWHWRDRGQKSIGEV